VIKYTHWVLLVLSLIAMYSGEYTVAHVYVAAALVVVGINGR
jgi:hypothetical protein